MATVAIVSQSNSLLIRVTVAAWLMSKLISWKLWVSYRLFPMVPVFDFFPDFPENFHFLLFGTSLTVLLLVFVFPEKRLLIIIAFLLEIIACLIDQLRWQPWQYQYILIFLFYIFSYKKPTGFLKLTAVLIGATYIYSGLHKLSPSFLDAIWGKLIIRRFGGLSIENFTDPLRYSGLLFGVTEIAIGVGLLFFENKKIFFWLCVVMHAFILLVLGPFGLNFNMVVWPWNVAMASCVWILFYKNQITVDVSFLKPTLHKLVFLLVGILPILNFAGLWDTYLSFNLYSGKTKRMYICNEKGIRYEKLQPYESDNKISTFCTENSRSINLSKMALTELNVPIYPEERTFKALKKEWLKKYPDNENTFIIYDYPHQIANIRKIE